MGADKMLQPFLAPKLPLWVIYSGLLAGQLAVGVTVYAIITHNHPCRCYCRTFMQHYAPRLASGQCYTLQVYNCVHHIHTRVNTVGAYHHEWPSPSPSSASASPSRDGCRCHHHCPCNPYTRGCPRVSVISESVIRGTSSSPMPMLGETTLQNLPAVFNWFEIR